MKIIRNIYFICLAGIVIFNSSCKKNTVSPTPDLFKVIATQHTIVGVKAVQLTNGNYVVAMHESDNNEYGLVFGLDQNGNEIWRKEFSTDIGVINDLQAINDSCFVMVSNNDFVAANYNAGYDVPQVVVTCIDASGKTKWSAPYNVPTDTINNGWYVNSTVLAIGSDSSINVMASFAGISGGGFDYNTQLVLLKYNNLGVLNSATQINKPGNPGNNNDYYMSEMIAGPDGFYVTGLFDSAFFTNANTTFLLKTDQTGNQEFFQTAQWWTTLATGYINIGTALCKGSSGNIIQAGSYLPNVPASVGGQPFLLVDNGNFYFQFSGNVLVNSFDANKGDTISSALFTLNSGLAQRISIANASDNGYIIAATGGEYQYNSYSPTQIALLKIDQNLKQQWQQTIHSAYPASPFSILQAGDGGFALFAIIQSFNNNQQLAFIKVNRQGVVTN